MPMRPPAFRPPGWQPALCKRPEIHDPFYGTQAWKRMRTLVSERDGHRCTAADCVTPDRGVGGRLVVDHIVERRKGGADHPSNLRTLCPSCERAHRVRRTEQVRSRPPCHIMRRFCDVDRSNGCPPTIRYHDQIAKRISGPIPLRRNREPPSRDDAADCRRVWLHPRCTQSQLFVFERKFNVVGRNQTDQK